MQKRKIDGFTVMMVLGVLFILVAGAICVGRAWGYLPDVAKVLMMGSISVGALCASYIVMKKNNMRATEEALFCIGEGFTGYLAVLLCEIFGNGSVLVEKESFIFSVVMLCPAVVKYLTTKRKTTFVSIFIILDVSIWAAMIDFHLKLSVYILLNMVVLILIYASMQFMKNEFEESKILKTIMLCLLYAQQGVMVMMFVISILVDRQDVICSVLIYGIMMVLAIWECQKKENNDLNMTQSIYAVSLTVMIGLYNLIQADVVETILYSTLWTVILVYSVWKNMKLFYLTSGITLALVFLQLTSRLWLSIEWWVYLLVAGCIMVGIAIYREKKLASKEEECYNKTDM